MLLRAVFAGVRKQERFDLEAVEMATRAAMHQAGATLIEGLLAMRETPATSLPCDCGKRARFHSWRAKKLHTVLGELCFERAYYHCPDCGRGQSPRDGELDVSGTDFSPGLRRMMAAVGSETSFERGSEQLDLLAGVAVNAKAVQRHAEAIGGAIAEREHEGITQAKQLELPEICSPPAEILYIEMDGTGVPVARRESNGRKGKTAGEPARTREAKLGCVFTQRGLNAKGRPQRDQDSTSYVAAIESAEDFGLRLYTEAWRRGWCRAKRKVVLGDGAVWIWNLAHEHFPGAIQIVDLFHARQHLWDLARSLHPNQDAAQTRWMMVHQQLLDNGKLKKLTVALRSIQTGNQELAEKLRTEADYFHRNALRMRYPKFRRLGLFVGSGVVEAGCRTVIAARLKRSGMFWSVKGANSILALRCCQINQRFEDFWASRGKAA